MATSILNMPLLQVPMQVGTDEDWLDAWAYVDASGAPISVAGLTLNFMVRTSPSSATVVVVASNAGALNGLPLNGAVLSGGVGGNVVALVIPWSTMRLLVAGTYVFEMQAQGDGYTRVIASGPVTVTQGVIR